MAPIRNGSSKTFSGSVNAQFDNLQVEQSFVVDSSRTRHDDTAGLVLRRLTTAERNALDVTAGSAGSLIFNTDTGRMEVYSGTAWAAQTPATDVTGGNISVASVASTGPIHSNTTVTADGDMTADGGQTVATRNWVEGAYKVKTLATNAPLTKSTGFSDDVTLGLGSAAPLTVSGGQLALLRDGTLTVGGDNRLSVARADATLTVDGVTGQLKGGYVGQQGVTISSNAVRLNIDNNTLKIDDVTAALRGNYAGGGGIVVVGNQIAANPDELTLWVDGPTGKLRGNYSGIAGITVTGNEISGALLQDEIATANTNASAAQTEAATALTTAGDAVVTANAVSAALVATNLIVGAQGISLSDCQTANANLTALSQSAPYIHALTVTDTTDATSASSAASVVSGGLGVGKTVMFATAAAAPTFTTRSPGTRLVLYPYLSGSAVDYAEGVEANYSWTSVPTSAQGHRWYAGTTKIMELSGTGDLTVNTITATGSGSGFQPLHANLTSLSQTTPTLPSLTTALLMIPSTGGGMLKLRSDTPTTMDYSIAYGNAGDTQHVHLAGSDDGGAHREYRFGYYAGDAAGLSNFHATHLIDTYSGRCEAGERLVGGAGATNYSSSSTTNVQNAKQTLIAGANNGGTTADTAYAIATWVKPGVGGQSDDSVATWYVDRYAVSGTDANTEVQLGLKAGIGTAGDVATKVSAWRSDGSYTQFGQLNSTFTGSGSTVVGNAATPSLAVGNFACRQVGVAAAANQATRMYFFYNAAGSSTANAAGLGLFGGPTLTVDGTGATRSPGPMYANSTDLVATQAWVSSTGGGGSGYQPLHANLTSLSQTTPTLPTLNVTSTAASSSATTGACVVPGGIGMGGFMVCSTQLGAPTLTTRSIGTRYVLYPSITSSVADHALGVENGYNWYGAPSTAQGHRWYGGTTKTAELSGNGDLFTYSSVNVVSAQTGISLPVTSTVANMAVGSFSAHQLGVASALNQSARVYFFYNAAGASATNTVGLGLWGASPLTVDGNGVTRSPGAVYANNTDLVATQSWVTSQTFQPLLPTYRARHVWIGSAGTSFSGSTFYKDTGGWANWDTTTDATVPSGYSAFSNSTADGALVISTSGMYSICFNMLAYDANITEIGLVYVDGSGTTLKNLATGAMGAPLRGQACFTGYLAASGTNKIMFAFWTATSATTGWGDPGGTNRQSFVEITRLS